MDENTAKLLSQLADKLGTTSEYLWTVLVRQAPISGAVDVLQYALIAIAVWLYIKGLPRAHARFEAFDTELSGGFYIFGGGFILVTLVLVAFFAVGNTVTAFVNPEYWALQHVLSAIKK